MYVFRKRCYIFHESSGGPTHLYLSYWSCSVNGLRCFLRRVLRHPPQTITPTTSTINRFPNIHSSSSSSFSSSYALNPPSPLLSSPSLSFLPSPPPAPICHTLPFPSLPSFHIITALPWPALRGKTLREVKFGLLVYRSIRSEGGGRKRGS